MQGKAVGGVRKSKHPRYKWELYCKESGETRTRYSNRRADLDELREQLQSEAAKYGAGAHLTAIERSAVIEYRARLELAGLELRSVLELGLERVETMQKSKPVSGVWSEYVEDRRRANRDEYYIKTDLIGKAEVLLWSGVILFLVLKSNYD